MEHFLYNLTSSDLDVYFAANTAGQAFIFLVAVLPALILNPLCAIALLLAEDVNWKMRVLIINIFATEICNSFGYVLILLGFSLRLSEIDDNSSCKLSLSLLIMAFAAKFLANAVYAVMVYVFLRNGIKRVKWYAVLLAVAAAWIVGVALGIPITFCNISYSEGGFCRSYSDSPLYRILLALTIAVVSVASCVIVTFSVLTFCYIKRNTLSGNSEVKKSIAKHLFYIAIAAVVTLVSNLIPASFPAIAEALADSVIASILVVDYAFRLLFASLCVITPIATIILLKPIRPALKQLLAKIGCHRNRGETANAEGRTGQGNEQGPNEEEQAGREQMNEFELANVGTQLAGGRDLTNEDVHDELPESTNETGLTTENDLTNEAELTNEDELTNADEMTKERRPGSLTD
jgi:hypothetical protein